MKQVGIPGSPCRSRNWHLLSLSCVDACTAWQGGSNIERYIDEGFIGHEHPWRSVKNCVGGRWRVEETNVRLHLGSSCKEGAESNWEAENGNIRHAISFTLRHWRCAKSTFQFSYQKIWKMDIESAASAPWFLVSPGIQYIYIIMYIIAKSMYIYIFLYLKYSLVKNGFEKKTSFPDILKLLKLGSDQTHPKPTFF